MEKHAHSQSQISILDLNPLIAIIIFFLIQCLHSFICISPHIYAVLVFRVLLLSIMRTSEMLKTQFVHLTIFHLVMRSEGSLWSGLGVNLPAIVMDQGQTGGPQKPYL